MLSLCRSFIMPQRVMSIAAAGSRRNLLLTSKLCYRVPEEFEPATGDNEDRLRSSILSTKSIEQMDTVVQQHLPVMNFKHLALSVKHFMHLAKEEKAGAALPGKPSFQRLSTSFLSKIRYLSVEDGIKMAQSASMLKLDCSCALVQGIYQKLRQRLNELDIEQIMNLQRCLGQLGGSSPLTDALKTSLPMVFETQIKKELDTTDETACLRALHFAVTHGVSSEIQDFVSEVSHRSLQKASTGYATSLILSIAFGTQSAQILRGNRARIVVRQCLEIVTEDLPQMDEKSIRRLMLAYGKLNIRQYELDKALFKLAPDWSFQSIMMLARLAYEKDALSLEHGHILKNLLLAHKDKLSTEANLLQVLNSADCLATLAVQSRTHVSGYEDLGHQLATVLEREKNAIREKPGRLVRFMLDLAILGVHPERELQWLFSDEFAKIAMSELSFIYLERLLDLELLVGNNLGTTSPYLLAPEIKEKVESLREPMNIDDTLVQSLQTALGGEEYLLERVMTPLGVVADLTVALRKGEYPIALGNKPDPLQDLPEDSHVVSILQCAAPRDMNGTTKMLRIPFALRERFLRAQDITTVVIGLEEWRNVTPDERIPFIMKRIKDALNHRLDRELQPNDRECDQESL